MWLKLGAFELSYGPRMLSFEFSPKEQPVITTMFLEALIN